MELNKIRSLVTFEQLIYGFVIGMITFWAAWSNRPQLFQPTDMVAIGDAFSKSQYIMGEAAEKWIDDSLTYAYSGVAYIKGQDPTTVNFEHPPLMKYYFGLSYLISGSVYFLNIIIFLLILLVFVLLAKKLILSQFSIIFSLIFFTTSTPLISHLGQSMLDSGLVLFTLVFLLLLLSEKIRDNNNIAVIGVVLGIITSIRYPLPFIILYLLVLMLWLAYKKSLRKIFLVFPFLIVTYLLTYTIFFIQGHSLWEFIKFEIYRFNWRLGNAPFAVPHIIHTLKNGCIQNWWSYSNPKLCTIDHDWRWWLPLLAALQFPAQLFLISKRNMKAVILGIFSTGYLILVFFGSFSQIRYLYPIIPIWILLCTLAAQYLFRIITIRYRNKQDTYFHSLSS